MRQLLLACLAVVVLDGRVHGAPPRSGEGAAEDRPPLPPACAADVTGDGFVDVQDKLGVITAWGSAGGSADVTRDGLVDVQDLVQVLANWGPCPAAQGPCPGKGDCLVAHKGTGCDDDSCCALVCAADPFCCLLEWDSACVDAARHVCGGAVCPGAGDCYAAHTGPGCECEPCCYLICARDPYCCQVSWDQACSDQAGRECRCPRCPAAGDCAVAHAGAGCEEESCCRAVCATRPECCTVTWDEACAKLARARCGEPCPGQGDCFKANPTPSCADAACCTSVCGADPYCCEVVWDQMCADLASARCASACVVICPSGAGDEQEPCGADTNGGCNGAPARYATIACGATVCGTAWSNGSVRDTDWFLVQTTLACTRLSVDLASEFPGLTYIVGGVESCAPELLSAPGDASFCRPGTAAAAELGPGTYVIFVATAGYDSFACGTRNGYAVSLRCAPAGLCDG
jgi:hypothetical protein